MFLDTKTDEQALDAVAEYHWLTRSDTQFYTVAQIAKRLGVANKTVLGWVPKISGAVLASQQAGWKLPRTGLITFLAQRLKEDPALEDEYPSTVMLISLADIGGDIWPTDSNYVETMRVSLQAGKPLPDLWVNRRADGVLEIIDGFHRYEALHAEEVPYHQAKVYDGLSEREVRLWRVAATYNKASDVIRKRAVRALREGFVSDIATVVRGVTEWMEPQRGEDGEVHAVPRKLPLPSDPLLALMVIRDHIYVTQDQESLWVKAVNSWQEEICKRLKLSQEDLRDKILGISALEAEGLIIGKTPQRRPRALFFILDVQLRDIVTRKLKAERSLSDSDLEIGLDWLGCGVDQNHAPWVQKRPKSEQLKMLNAMALVDLAAAYKAAAVEEMQPPEQVKPKRSPEPLYDPTFARAATKFGSRSNTPHPSPNTALTYDIVHQAMEMLVQTIERLDADQGKSWRESGEARADWQLVLRMWEGGSHVEK